MMVRQWIKSAQAVGWVPAGVSASQLQMVCGCTGCTGHLVVPIGNPGPTPEPCSLPHDRGHARKVFDEYRVLVAELRKRRRALGLDQIDVQTAMGAADGYINKLESFAKVASPPTLILWCETLGLRLTTSPAKLPEATLRAVQERQARPYNAKQARWKHDAA